MARSMLCLLVALRESATIVARLATRRETAVIRKTTRIRRRDNRTAAMETRTSSASIVRRKDTGFQIAISSNRKSRQTLVLTRALMRRVQPVRLDWAFGTIIILSWVC